jgi:four helix bundle protein
MLRMRMFPCTLLDPVAFLTALCGVVRQEALGSDLRRMKGRKSGRVERKNVNRGYRKLTVWEDAIAYYAATCQTFCGFAFVLQRVGSQQIASVDSIHRNIAEGYCRRSLKEYLHFLNIALASAGESVSGLHAFHAAKQIADVDFERLDAAAFKLENSLKRLIESLQKKDLTGTWDDSFVIRKTNTEYRTDEEPGA